MDFFKARVWPRLQERAAGGGLLLFVPQYFDFVRLRWARRGGTGVSRAWNLLRLWPEGARHLPGLSALGRLARAAKSPCC
jgi:hypothetical protein